MPFASWGTDEVTGILQLLRGARHHALHLLEQARFVDELKTERGMSVAEIAQQLSRSKAWVSMRLGLMAEMSPDGPGSSLCRRLSGLLVSLLAAPV